ncbi:MAG: outer membrane beta-barrel protein [Candidatus Eisenbacteria bacterium]|uniref:Outer membrane beta-barrel protein n=1 Tax=Eiseniibacteriota bacterium TaxID=2212470 RepID=A0A9D6L6W6_UNCEI|nr:outer membrane beta-barrel protein [Candidatus Eisenbacteria bacterium]MBI3539891.1 outer membrane beta-barrel protein [Candidatus Eisenbacteria bacterium]
MRFATRRLAVGLVCAIASLAVAGAARASGSELIPSIGVTRSVHDSNADAQVYGGLAVRTTMLPGLKAEIGAAYRSEDRNGGSLKVRQWPVTGSLWLTPLPVIYAGGGVGWYHTTFDYAPALAIANQTTEKFGVHLGGGLEVPLGPAALDLNGRYVFLGTEQSQLPPQKFNPDFWTTTLGLAIRF